MVRATVAKVDDELGNVACAVHYAYGEAFSDFFFSSRRRHTRCSRDWIQTCALPILKLFVKVFVFLPLLLLASAFQPTPAGGRSAGQDLVLKAADITPKLFPEHVFFRGQVAPAQLRNTGGVHFADDLYLLAGLVDSSGYSTAIKEKYQGDLLSEVNLEIGGQALKPRAYGFGFVGGKFILMGLGANNLIEAAGQRDAEMKRPVPLQVLASANAGSYRLHVGRDYIEFRRAN